MEIKCNRCEKTRIVKNVPKNPNALCRSCTAYERKVWKKPVEQLKRLWYFCPTCPSIRAVRQQKKTAFCSECTGKFKHIPVAERSIAKLEEQQMKHFRICIECNDKKEVSSAVHSGLKLCKKCTDKKRAENKKVKIKKDRKPRVVVKKVKTKKTIKKKQTVVGGIDGKQKVKINTQRQPKKKQLSYDEMIAEFLSKNEVTVIQPSNFNEVNVGTGKVFF